MGANGGQPTGPIAHGSGTVAVPDPCGVNDGPIVASDGSLVDPDLCRVSDEPGSALLAASDGSAADDHRHGHTRDA